MELKKLNTDNIPKKPRLIEQIKTVMRVRHYSKRTEETYINLIRDFILFHEKKHPLLLGANEISKYISYLAVKRNVSSSTQNQALCAIIFLYKHVLNKELEKLELIWAKKGKRLPVVFTKTEVKAVMTKLTGVNWIMANLLYGSGLRLMECIRLRVKDIDFEYNQENIGHFINSE